MLLLFGRGTGYFNLFLEKPKKGTTPIDTWYLKTAHYFWLIDIKTKTIIYLIWRHRKIIVIKLVKDLLSGPLAHLQENQITNFINNCYCYYYFYYCHYYYHHHLSIGQTITEMMMLLLLPTLNFVYAQIMEAVVRSLRTMPNEIIFIVL